MPADAPGTSRTASILIGGLAALSLAVLGVTLFRHADAARAAANTIVAGEIAQEDSTFCGALGIEPRTVRHDSCVRGLIGIRQRQKDRTMTGMLGIF